MKTAALRLDSFSGANARAAAVTALDLEEAYHRGHDLGLAQGREHSLDALTRALSECRDDLVAGRHSQEMMRRDILAGLVPVLHANVDLLGPQGKTERLCQMLIQEISRLAENAPEQRVVLQCPIDLRPDLLEQLDLANFPQVQIEDATPDQPLVRLVSGSGSITFDPALITAGLKSIIDDINTEE